MKHHLPKLLTMTSALAVAFSALLVTGPTPAQAAVELKIESWRSDDIDKESVLTGDYNASIDRKIAHIKEVCGV